MICWWKPRPRGEPIIGTLKCVEYGLNLANGWQQGKAGWENSQA